LQKPNPGIACWVRKAAAAGIAAGREKGNGTMQREGQRKGRSVCERPKSREETPKVGSDASAWPGAPLTHAYGGIRAALQLPLPKS